ncbi:MAG: M23 family metallopeptidase [Sphingomicrobium sp.]
MSLSTPPQSAVASRSLWLGLGALLCSGVAVAAMPRTQPMPEAEQVQWQALGIAPLARGGDTGLRMNASEAAEPIALAPQRQRLDLRLTAAGEPTGAMLVRAGAAYGDAMQAGAMIGAVPAGTPVHLVLGDPMGGARAIASIDVTPRMDLRLNVIRGVDGALQLQRQQLAVDMTPLRIRGRAGDGLYWALRAAGASPEATAEYLRAVATEIDVGSDVGPNDAFDLVIASRKAASGERVMGPLLYAGVQRIGARPIQLVRWSQNGRADWVDAANLDQPAQQQSVGMGRPVNGPITSTFGWRYHPILHFGRMHRGVDFGASWGSPIFASASGEVTAAGWAGGYGRQVRISHGGGIASSYSHMSSIVAQPGAFVRQGQLIGYVGASGLATGPHLHYEVYMSGQAVNPLAVHFTSAAPMMANNQAKAIKARLQALLKVGTKQG